MEPESRPYDLVVYGATGDSLPQATSLDRNVDLPPKGQLVFSCRAVCAECCSKMAHV